MTRKDVAVLRRIFGVQNIEKDIICVDNRRIYHLNHIHRKNNQPTELLSFPYWEVQLLSRLIILLFARFISNISFQLIFHRVGLFFCNVDKTHYSIDYKKYIISTIIYPGTTKQLTENNSWPQEEPAINQPITEQHFKQSLKKNK